MFYYAEDYETLARAIGRSFPPRLVLFAFA